MVVGAKDVVPNVEDQLAALQLDNSAKANAAALGLLRDAVIKVCLVWTFCHLCWIIHSQLVFCFLLLLF